MRIFLFLFIFALLAQPAAAIPPIDGDGRFQHVVTLRPARMAQPLALQAPVRMFASAQAADGALLLIGDGEYLLIDPKGKLERQPFDQALPSYPTFGLAVVQKDAAQKYVLYYCDQQGKALRKMSELGSKLTTIAGNLDLGNTCQVFADGHNGFSLLQGWPIFGWHVDAKGQVGEKFAMEFPVRKQGTAAKPCGQEPGGRAIAALRDHDGADLALVRLDGNFLPEKTLWTLNYKDQPLGGYLKNLRLDASQGCSFVADQALFWLHNQTVVFQKQELVSALRGEATIDPNNSHVMAGLGPYAAQILSLSAILPGGALETVERDQGDIRLYLPKLPPPAGKWDAAAKAYERGGDFARAYAAWTQQLATHADDNTAQMARIALLSDSGWWETAVDEGRKLSLSGTAQKTLNAIIGKARSKTLLRWAARSSMVGPIPQMPSNPLPQLLTEAQELTTTLPDEPLAHLAAARLAKLAGKRSEFYRHLQPLVAFLHKGTLRVAECPEIFELLAQKGDVAGMKKFVAALDKNVMAEDRLRYEATTLRADGKFTEALKILEKVANDQPALLALKAQLLVDVGDLNEAILTWTTALQNGLDREPEAQAGIGVAYLRRGLVELAVQAFLKALGQDGENAAVKSNLASAYAAMDKRDDAMQQLFGALAKTPTDPLLRYQLEAMGQPKVAPSTDLRPLAILPLDTAGGSQQRVGLGDMLAAMLTTAVVESNGPPVVERAKLDAILAEQKLTRSAKFDAKTAVQLGKLIGAKRVMVGNVAEFDGKLAIDVRIVDSATAKVLTASHADCALDIEALRKVIAALVVGVNH